MTSSSRQPSRRRPPPGQGYSLYALQYVEEVLLELDVGEVALFHSDGLVEAHDPKGEMFGFPRLRELVARHGEDRLLDETLLEELYSLGPTRRRWLSSSSGRLSVGLKTSRTIRPAAAPSSVTKRNIVSIALGNRLGSLPAACRCSVSRPQALVNPSGVVL